MVIQRHTVKLIVFVKQADVPGKMQFPVWNKIPEMD